MPAKKAAKRKAVSKKPKAKKTPAKKRTRKRKAREMRLEGEAFWRYRAKMAICRESRADAQAAARALEDERKHPIYATLIKREDDKRRTEDQLAEALREFAAVQQQIADDFGLTLDQLLSHEFTINEDDGVIHFFSPKEAS
jgi:hypothetical protein